MRAKLLPLACSLAAALASGCSTVPGFEPAETRRAVIATERGDIVVELRPAEAPVTTANFIALARAGVLDGGSFYRTVSARNDRPDAVPIDIIQGGVGFDGAEGVAPIAHETTAQTGLSHTPGAISMARDEVGTASSEFFIVINDARSLDSGPGGRNPDEAGYAVFGYVIEGMDVVDAIWNSPAGDPEAPEGFEAQWLAPPVRIETVRMQN